MKKAVVAILIVCLLASVFCFVACNKKTDKQQKPNDGSYYVDEETTLGELAEEIKKNNYTIELSMTSATSEGIISMSYYITDGAIKSVSNFNGMINENYEYIKGDVAYSFDFTNTFYNETTKKMENYPEGQLKLDSFEKYDKMFAGQQEVPFEIDANDENINSTIASIVPEGAELSFENGVIKITMKEDMGGQEAIVTMCIKNIGTTVVEIPAECAEKETDAEWKSNIDYQGVSYSRDSEYNIEKDEWEKTNSYRASISIDDENAIFEYTVLAKINGMPITTVSAYTSSGVDTSLYTINVYFNEDGEYVGDYASIENEVSFDFSYIEGATIVFAE